MVICGNSIYYKRLIAYLYKTHFRPIVLYGCKPWFPKVLASDWLQSAYSVCETAIKLYYQ